MIQVTSEVNNISWKDIEEYCRRISTQLILEKNKSVDVIVPIVRGGLVPATIISNMIDIDNVRPLVWQTRDSQVRDVDAWRSLVESGKQILLVDDMIDSGKTLFELGELIQLSDLANIHVATLIMNTSHSYQHPLIDRSIFVRTIDKSVDPRWIVFPWEKTK